MKDIALIPRTSFAPFAAYENMALISTAMVFKIPQPNQFFSDADTTYTQLAGWRKTLARLRRFVRLLDLMVRNMLNRTVRKATEFFLAFVAVSNHDGKCELDTDEYELRQEAATL